MCLIIITASSCTPASSRSPRSAARSILRPRSPATTVIELQLGYLESHRRSSITGTTTYELKFQWTATQPSRGKLIRHAFGDRYQQPHRDVHLRFLGARWHRNLALRRINATWPTSLPPSQELLSAPAFPTDNASVDATSGSLDTDIDLPSYNPNVPAPSP